jgi:hypothetical protein
MAKEVSQADIGVWLRTTGYGGKVVWKMFSTKRSMRHYARMNAITINAKDWHIGKYPPQFSHPAKEKADGKRSEL